MICGTRNSWRLLVTAHVWPLSSMKMVIHGCGSSTCQRAGKPGLSFLCLLYLRGLSMEQSGLKIVRGLLSHCIVLMMLLTYGLGRAGAGTLACDSQCVGRY